MKKRTNKLLSMLLALVLVVGLLPTTALAADMERISVTDGQPNSELPTGASWNQASSTLTLDNYNGGAIGCGTSSSGDGAVVIELKNKNTITVNESQVGLQFMNMSGGITFIGSGSLIINMNGAGEDRIGISFQTTAASYIPKLTLSDSVSVSINLTQTGDACLYGIDMGVVYDYMTDSVLTIQEGAELNITMNSGSAYETHGIRTKGTADIQGTLNITGTAATSDQNCSQWCGLSTEPDKKADCRIGENAKITVDMPKIASCGSFEDFPLAANENKAIGESEWTVSSGQKTFKKANFKATLSDNDGARYADYKYEQQSGTTPTTASYTVKHMQEKLDPLGTYEEVTADAQALTGNVGDNTAAAAKEYPGFTAKAVTQKEITEDGKTVVEIEYDRNRAYIHFDGNGADSGTMEDQEFVFGESAKPLTANAFTRTGYTFSGWSHKADGACDWTDQQALAIGEHVENDFVATIYALWEKDATPPATANYTVKHMQEKLDSTYELVNTETLTGNVGEMTNAAATEYPGFSLGGVSIEQKEITADGKTEVVIKYFRNWATIHFEPNGGTYGWYTQDFVYGQPETTLMKNTFTRPGYKFIGWNDKKDGTGTFYPDEAVVDPSELCSEKFGQTHMGYMYYAQWEEIASHPHTGTKVTGQAPTCIVEGWKDYYKCDVCGRLFEDAAYTKEISDLDYWKIGDGKLDKVPHTPGTEWKHDNTNHWHECSVCNTKVDTAAHTMKEVIDKAATETTTGQKHNECTVCGYKTAPETIPVIPSITTATVTFKIVNGTWDGKDSKDKTVTVTLTNGKGTLNTGDIPTGMKASSGYEGGKWDKTPATDVTGDATYTYTFTKKPSGGGSGGGGGSFSAPTYSITVMDSQNGKISSSDKSASKDEIIKLTVKADEGYELADLVVTDSKGQEVKLTEKNGLYTFKMPASKVQVEASFQKTAPAFADVPADAYYADAVEWAVQNGVTADKDAATFAPNLSCTRAQAVTFLWRNAGSPDPVTKENPFVDVPANAYYAEAVLWAVENGITMGVTETTFVPDTPCTRAQIVTFLWRSLKKPVVTSENPFVDVAASAYYKDAVLWAVENGVTKGVTETAFQPDAFCTRAQIVTFMYCAFNK